MEFLWKKNENVSLDINTANNLLELSLSPSLSHYLSLSTSNLSFVSVNCCQNAKHSNMSREVHTTPNLQWFYCDEPAPLSQPPCNSPSPHANPSIYLQSIYPSFHLSIHPYSTNPSLHPCVNALLLWVYLLMWDWDEPLLGQLSQGAHVCPYVQLAAYQHQLGIGAELLRLPMPLWTQGTNKQHMMSDIEGEVGGRNLVQSADWFHGLKLCFKEDIYSFKIWHCHSGWKELYLIIFPCLVFCYLFWFTV